MVDGKEIYYIPIINETAHTEFLCGMLFMFSIQMSYKFMA